MTEAKALTETYAAEIDYLARVSWQDTPVLPPMSADEAVETIDRFIETLAEDARPALEVIARERCSVACGLRGPTDERVVKMREGLREGHHIDTARALENALRVKAELRGRDRESDKDNTWPLFQSPLPPVDV